eukprot:350252-Chlamydomonas_euryale.AAC.1
MRAQGKRRCDSQLVREQAGSLPQGQLRVAWQPAPAGWGWPATGPVEGGLAACPGGPAPAGWGWFEVAQDRAVQHACVRSAGLGLRSAGVPTAGVPTSVRDKKRSPPGSTTSPAAQGYIDAGPHALLVPTPLVCLLGAPTAGVLTRCAYRWCAYQVCAYWWCSASRHSTDGDALERMRNASSMP